MSEPASQRVVPPDDDILTCLEGETLNSSAFEGTSYRLTKRIGAGGMSIAFLAVRRSPSGSAPVVVKVMRPFVMRQSARTGNLIVLKETVALGRLNEKVPPTPFVVRLIETGSSWVSFKNAPLELPWLALEYVHGGSEGTTLHERVHYSVQRTGYAFDPIRTKHAVECLAIGLDAIHDVGVVHRDLTPANVLCCGFGRDEIFKIADFGIARPAGTGGFTFGGVPVGTPGYAAPEQVEMNNDLVGNQSDVFSLAAVTYRMLTGEDYFPSSSPIDAVLAARADERRSITESRNLAPELLERPNACLAIDEVLARATSTDPRVRPPSGAAFAAMLAPALRGDSAVSMRTTARRLKSIAEGVSSTLFAGYDFIVRNQPGSDHVVRSVAWDGDGRCLAASNYGLAFWNGTNWESAPAQELPVKDGVRFVRRVGAGRWLVGGDQATICEYSTSGIGSVLKGPDPKVSFTHASGEMDDLAVLVGERSGEPPLLYAIAGGHWLKPAQLTKAESVNALARIGPEEWLVVGRAKDGYGFAVRYRPTMWSVEKLSLPRVRAFLGCAGVRETGSGVVVGATGRTARTTDEEPWVSVVPGEPDLSAVALDVGGRAWATSPGQLWLQAGAPGSEWRPVWREDWHVPFVSVYADLGIVIAMTVDGAIVEGRDDA
ncbi:MAG: serine/threonine-protein kinase [Polyangiaceae bacterium]